MTSRKRACTLVQNSSLWNRLDPDVLSWMSATDPDPEFVRGQAAERICEARRCLHGKLVSLLAWARAEREAP